MKKGIYNLVFGVLLLGTNPVYAAATLDDVVSALTSLRSALSTICKSINDTITTTFNSVFNGIYDSSTKKLSDTSSIAKTMDVFVKDFYSWYGSYNSNGTAIMATPTIATTDNLFNISSSNNDTISDILKRDAGYNINRSDDNKALDSNALLVTTVEGGVNDLDASTIDSGLSVLGTSATSDTFMGNSTIFPQEGLSSYAPTLSGTLPNSNDLLGIDLYSSSVEQNKAQLFISYLLHYFPAPTNFKLPDNSTSANTVSVCPPGNEDGTQCKTVSTVVSSGSSSSDYSLMLDYFKQQSTYQKYKLNVRTMNVLRSLYLEPIYRAYQERVKGTNNHSLTELEALYANEGMTNEYYTNLSNKTMAEVNLEMLRTMNKMVYFMYRLHKDNEQMKILTAIGNLNSLNFSAIQNKTTYIDPITKMITNECWKDGDNKTECQDLSS